MQVETNKQVRVQPCLIERVGWSIDAVLALVSDWSILNRIGAQSRKCTIVPKQLHSTGKIFQKPHLLGSDIYDLVGAELEPGGLFRNRRVLVEIQPCYVPSHHD